MFIFVAFFSLVIIKLDFYLHLQDGLSCEMWAYCGTNVPNSGTSMYTIAHI